VSGPFPSLGSLRLKESAGGTVAETRHVGPPAEYKRTYGIFLESLIAMGYSLEGPARETFDEVSDSLGPGMGSMIQQPVRKRP
jgi:hypothetical protein